MSLSSTSFFQFDIVTGGILTRAASVLGEHTDHHYSCLQSIHTNLPNVSAPNPALIFLLLINKYVIAKSFVPVRGCPVVRTINLQSGVTDSILLDISQFNFANKCVSNGGHCIKAFNKLLPNEFTLNWLH